MKSLFYGAAVAAVTGLLMGAGFKMPAVAEEADSIQEIAGFQTAEMDGYAAPASYSVTQAYVAIPVSAPAYTPDYASYDDAYDAEPGTKLTPAVYTVEDEGPAPAPVSSYRLVPADPQAAPRNLISSAEPAADAPAVVEHSQGFGLASEDEVAPS